MNKKLNQGYTALISILIISSVLFLTVLDTNAGSLDLLFNVWSRHSKLLSLELAESCLDQAVVRILQNPNYQILENGEQIKIEKFSCDIVSVEKNEQFFIIQTEASVNKIFTKIESVFDSENFKIISTKEI